MLGIFVNSARAGSPHKAEIKSCQTTIAAASHDKPDGFIERGVQILHSNLTFRNHDLQMAVLFRSCLTWHLILL